MSDFSVKYNIFMRELLSNQITNITLPNVIIPTLPMNISMISVQLEGHYY